MVVPSAPKVQSRQRELARELLTVTRQHWDHVATDRARAYAHAIHTARLLGLSWRRLADALDISDRTARNIYAAHYRHDGDQPGGTDT